MSAEDRLDHIASSISDGLDVDWSAEESDASGTAGKAGTIALPRPARITEFHRGLQGRRDLPDSDRPESVSPGPSSSEPQRWGDLTLLEPIGSEARGEVWRAWDAKLLREVALKFLRTGGGEVRSPGGDPGSGPLLAEARALARVHHPGVVAIHGIAE